MLALDEQTARRHNEFMKYILNILTLLIFTSCLNPGASKNKAEIITGMANSISKSYSDVPQVTIEDYQKRENTLLVDVRSQAEVAVSQIPNSITRKEFENLFHNDKEKLKGKLIVTYCTIGKRASEYAREIRKKGLQSAALKESILGWTQRQLPLVDAQNQPTLQVHVGSEAWNLVPDNYKAKWE